MSSWRSLSAAQCSAEQPILSRSSTVCLITCGFSTIFTSHCTVRTRLLSVETRSEVKLGAAIRAATSCASCTSGDRTMRFTSKTSSACSAFAVCFELLSPETTDAIVMSRSRMFDASRGDMTCLTIPWILSVNSSMLRLSEIVATMLPVDSSFCTFSSCPCAALRAREDVSPPCAANYGGDATHIGWGGAQRSRSQRCGQYGRDATSGAGGARSPEEQVVLGRAFSLGHPRRRPLGRRD